MRGSRHSSLSSYWSPSRCEDLVDTDAPSDESPELDEDEFCPCCTVLTMLAHGLHSFISVIASIRQVITVWSCVEQFSHTSNRGRRSSCRSGVSPVDPAGGPWLAPGESR